MALMVRQEAALETLGRFGSWQEAKGVTHGFRFL